jgi:ribosomal protein S18 acetylase RimI-like enzyme
MQIQVRTANASDAGCIAAVEVKAWQSAYRNLMPDSYLGGLSVAVQTERWARSLSKHQHDGKKRTVVGMSGNEVTGFATVGRDPDEAGVGLLYLLYVLPEHWSRGVGQALMAAAMEELRDLGLREAVLWVLRENRRACRFYDRLGWQADGRVRRDDYGGVVLEAVCYRRAVAP